MSSSAVTKARIGLAGYSGFVSTQLMGRWGAVAIILTESQMVRFATDGYLILRGFFSGSEIAELRDAAKEILSKATLGAPGVGFDP